MSEYVPYFPPPPNGEHIRAFLAESKGDVRAAMRELHQLGWRKDKTRAEPVPEHLAHMMKDRTEVYPWWTSPTGKTIRGLKTAMRAALLALENPLKPDPSPMAQRVLKALEQHPELREELRTLLR